MDPEEGDNIPPLPLPMLINYDTIAKDAWF